MFSQFMKLAGRNEDPFPANKYRARRAFPFTLPPTPTPYCIAAQRISESEHTNVMAFKHFLQTSFMQSILSFLPSLRHSIEAPQQAEAATPPPAHSPVDVAVEPWKEEVDRWRLLADKTAAERDQLRHEAGRLHTEMQRLVHDLGQVRVDAEETWKRQEEELRREKAEALREAEEQLRRERDEALREAEERLTREREEAVRKAEESVESARSELQAAAAELNASKREQTALQAMLDTRRTEIVELRQIVGSDKLGDDDVVQLVKNLNDEIARTAKVAKDLFKLDRGTRANSKVAMEASSAIEGWVGSALPGLLSTQYRGNAVLVQAAMQAMAVGFSSWISSSYSFMHEHDQILDETYKFVMNSGMRCFI